MDHSHMDHSPHIAMGHGDVSETAMCSMNMLFTWDTTNLCIVFRSWRITTPLSLTLSLLLIIALTAAYEALRALTRRYTAASTQHIATAPRALQVDVARRAHLVKAALYGVQNFYAFMIMLVFMTYNGWVMVAVAVGAFAGYLLFGEEDGGVKETACH